MRITEWSEFGSYYLLLPSSFACRFSFLVFPFHCLYLLWFLKLSPKVSWMVFFYGGVLERWWLTRWVCDLCERWWWCYRRSWHWRILYVLSGILCYLLWNIGTLLGTCTDIHGERKVGGEVEDIDMDRFEFQELCSGYHAQGSRFICGH